MFCHENYSVTTQGTGHSEKSTSQSASPARLAPDLAASGLRAQRGQDAGSVPASPLGGSRQALPASPAGAAGRVPFSRQGSPCSSSSRSALDGLFLSGDFDFPGLGMFHRMKFQCMKWVTVCVHTVWIYHSLFIPSQDDKLWVDCSFFVGYE